MTEFLQYLDYFLVGSFKVGKRRLKYYQTVEKVMTYLSGLWTGQEDAALTEPDRAQKSACLHLAAGTGEHARTAHHPLHALWGGTKINVSVRSNLEASNVSTALA